MTAGDGVTSLANLGISGIARRRGLAAFGLAVALAGLVTIDVMDLAIRWRALLALPLWFAALCWFQSAAKT